MNPTTIENKPKTYTRPILLTKNNRPYIQKKEYVEEKPKVFVPIDIQYLFDNNLSSSPSSYDLTSNGSISYETSPKSVYLDGSSYLLIDTDIDIKTLSFWFKADTPKIDTCLISTNNNIFNIKVSNTELNITVNNVIETITQPFISYTWYHLLLNYSNEKYEIYINSNLISETVNYTELTNNTLYLGKSLKSYNHNLISITQTYSLYKTHEMVAIDSNIYLFGDLHTDSDLYNKLYKIDLNTDTMEEIAIQNTGDSTTTIKSRHFISMVSFEKYIYICGGINDLAYSTIFISINTETNYFEFQSFSGTDNIPTSRTGHSIVVIPKQEQDSIIVDNYIPDLYIFGGYYPDGTSTTYFNDLYKFTASLDISTKITLNGNAPTERSHHSMVTDGVNLYIFGGYKSAEYYNDFYTININTNNSVKTDFTTITKRAHHKMTIIENNIFIFGGKNSNEEILYDMHIIDKTKLELIHSFDSVLPQNLQDYSMSVSNNDIYIYGGLIKRYTDSGEFNTNDIQSNLYKISDIITYFNGNIADLRLYNYSNTDITTIYNDIYHTIPSTTYTITFDSQATGSLNMLSTVPNETTVLNIINNNILYNSVYEEGSGLYIDFTKTNLQYVLKVTITNNGTIYGRGGIGQISSSDNRSEGKYAITVLNNPDNINREITITGGGDIYGGGDGGDYIQSYRYTYPYLFEADNGSSIETLSYWTTKNISFTPKNGGNAKYYNGTELIAAGAASILPKATIIANRPALSTQPAQQLNKRYIHNSYTDLNLGNGGQDFDTDKIIDLPLNGLVIIKP